jgi:hypothetical protein
MFCYGSQLTKSLALSESYSGAWKDYRFYSNWIQIVNGGSQPGKSVNHHHLLPINWGFWIRYLLESVSPRRWIASSQHWQPDCSIHSGTGL